MLQVLGKDENENQITLATKAIKIALENAKMEFLIVCIGYNFKKYHNYRLKKEKESKQIEVIN